MINRLFIFFLPGTNDKTPDEVLDGLLESDSDNDVNSLIGKGEYLSLILCHCLKTILVIGT